MAEVVRDENGNEIDLTKILTMVKTIHTFGSNGTEKWFVSHHQYQFSAVSMRAVEDEYQADYGNVMMYHYEIVLESETFYIPKLAAVIENRLRPWYEQDFHGWVEHKSDQPRDFIGAYKEVTGIDLKKRAEQPEHDGFEIMKDVEKNMKKDQGKSYGPGFKEDPEDLRRDPA
jgi:hypothetical protein